MLRWWTTTQAKIQAWWDAPWTEVAELRTISAKLSIIEEQDLARNKILHKQHLTMQESLVVQKQQRDLSEALVLSQERSNLLLFGFLNRLFPGDSTLAGLTLDDVINEANAETSIVDSVVKFLDGLHDQLQQSRNDQAKLDLVLNTIRSNRTRIADAITANTPAADPSTAETDPSIPALGNAQDGSNAV